MSINIKKIREQLSYAPKAHLQGLCHTLCDELDKVNTAAIIQTGPHAHIAEVERLRNALDRILLAGNMCANCCYNLGQPEGHNMLSDSKKASMFKSAKAWQTAIQTL